MTEYDLSIPKKDVQTGTKTLNNVANNGLNISVSINQRPTTNYKVMLCLKISNTTGTVGFCLHVSSKTITGFVAQARKLDGTGLSVVSPSLGNPAELYWEVWD